MKIRNRRTGRYHIIETSNEGESYNHFRSTSVDSSPIEVADRRAQLLGFNFINLDTVPVYVKAYDSLAADITMGTTTPVKTWMVPAQGTTGITNKGFIQHYFKTALTIAITTEGTDSGTTSPAADTQIIDLTYS